MRKIITTTFVTMDGVMQAPGVIIATYEPAGTLVTGTISA